ncbi:MAG: hypothetical protein ACPLYF_00100 [Fervidobacterium sp.]
MVSFDDSYNRSFDITFNFGDTALIKEWRGVLMSNGEYFFLIIALLIFIIMLGGYAYGKGKREEDKLWLKVLEKDLAITDIQLFENTVSSRMTQEAFRLERKRNFGKEYVV